MTELLATGATGAALGTCICKALDISGVPATVSSVAVGAVVGLGWNWLKKLDRSNMYNCFKKMNKNQYLKVQFLWSSNVVNKCYSRVTKTSTIENPYPGTYGTWHKNKYGYLYRL